MPGATLIGGVGLFFACKKRFAQAVISGHVQRPTGQKEMMMSEQTTSTRRMVIGAHATNDNGEDPQFCVVSVTPEFLKDLQELHEICERYRLSEVRRANCPDRWGNPGWEDDLRLQDGSLVMTSIGDFWFEDMPKHGDHRIQSSPCTLEDLQALLAESAEELVFSDDDTREVYEARSDEEDLADDSLTSG